MTKEYKLSKKYKISYFINYSFYIETITIIYKPINSVQNGVLLF